MHIIGKRKVQGIPTGMRVIANTGNANAAIVLNSPMDATTISECVSDHGVCVYVKGQFGELYFVSMYCQFGEELAPSLTYMDHVIERARGKLVIFALDANAISQMWHSKAVSRSRENEIRGRELETYILEKDLSVLNEPSEH